MFTGDKDVEAFKRAIDQLDRQDYKKAFILALAADHLHLNLSPRLIEEAKEFQRELNGEGPLCIPSHDEREEREQRVRELALK
jgi:hypothetical protein